MHRLKLQPEIQCYPTWVYRDGVYDNVSPASLNVSGDLAAALDEWADRWDATYDLVNDPANPHFSSPNTEQQFWADGRRLAIRLQEELNHDWTVHFDPEELT
ncbi:hypothetical protein ABIA39_007753 [Nocardia sp. GAS34]|uniref:hypothetical protein n=1 Tax=unclassified Nocardia TaxID=2637762 RepID=UPI003D260B6C